MNGNWGNTRIISIEFVFFAQQQQYTVRYYCEHFAKGGWPIKIADGGDFEIRDRARSEIIRIFADNVGRSDRPSVSVSRGEKKLPETKILQPRISRLCEL